MSLSLRKIYFLTERYQVFDQNLIKQFRKEFLTLAKNLKNVTTYEQAREMSQYLNNWRGKLEKHLSEIRSNLKSFEYRRDNEDSYYKREAEALQKYMQPVWDFEFELGAMPYNITSPQYNYKTKKHDIWRKGDLVGDDREDFRKWEQKLRKKARDAWKWLEDFARFTAKTSDPFKAHFKEKENIEIEGFPVQLVGYENTETDRERLEKMRAGLKTYRSRANRIAPWLLKYQLPIVADFTSRAIRENAASYEIDHINVTVWGLTTTGREFAQLMAHEMGHHVYSRIMSKAQQEDWSKFIHGDYKDLDLREILKKAKPGEKLRDLEERIKKTDPILKLQIEGLIQHHDIYTLQDIQEHLDTGKDPIVSVPAHPITSYATKNPTEAFCEALGTIVAYGPRTLPPKVKYMLGVLSPIRIWAESRIPSLSEAYFLDEELIGEARKRPSLMPAIQYHTTSWNRIPSILKKGLQLPRSQKDVSTFTHNIPSISTTDDPENAQMYHPRGALLKLKTKGKYLKRTMRQMKKDENLLDAVNRWSNEALKKGVDGFWVEGMQSLVGNQTFNPNVLEIIEIVNMEDAPEEIKLKMDEGFIKEKTNSFRLPQKILDGTGNDYEEDGILVKNIPIKAITMLKQQGEGIVADIQRGELSRTEGSPVLWYDTGKQQLIVDDGNHRIFQQWLQGKDTVDAVVYSSDYHNYLRSVYEGEEKFDWDENYRTIDEEFIGKKGGLSYFQPGGSLPKGLYNRKNGKPTRDPGVAGLKRKKDED